jgi:Flp pilus assembly pilin Flp/chaperonin cofactor prefoldin
MFIKLYSRTKRFFRASDGSSAVEYALLASLISLALILSVGLMGTTLSGSYEKVADATNGLSSAHSGNSNEIGNIGNDSENDGPVLGQGGTPPRAEHLRARAEHLRARAEHLRVRAEHLRVKAEHLRVKAEHLRVRVERLRVRVEHLQAKVERLQAGLKRLQVWKKFSRITFLV